MRSLAFMLLAALLVPGCRKGAAPPDGDAAPPAEPAAAAPAPAPPSCVALVGGTLFDATGAEPLADAVVVVRDGLVAAAGPRDAVEIPEGAQVVELEGRWVLPGLVDAHVHFFQSGGLYTRPDIVDLRAVRAYSEELARIDRDLGATLRRTLASGVTAVVDMGGPMWNFDVRERAGSLARAPRVAVAGPLVSTVSRQELDLGDPPIIRAASPEEARTLVRKQLEMKPDLVKVWFIVTPERGLDETLAVARAAIEEAHAGGVRVAVHATELETARAAVQAGADILVHSVDDTAVDAEFVKLVRDRGVIYIPNLVVLEGYAEVLGMDVRLGEMEERYGDPAVTSTWDDFASVAGEQDLASAGQRKQRYLAREPVMRANLAAMGEAGVVIAAGTDAGNIGTVHGPSLHRELELMAAAGMSPREVVLSATRDAARVFSADPAFGTVEVGKQADLIVVDASPLDDIANLGRIHLVVRAGVPWKPAQIIAPNPEWVVQRQVEAYNARDIDLFLSFYAEDAVIVRHPQGEVVAHGLDAMRETYSGLFRKSPDLLCRILGRIVTGSMVVDRELVTGIPDRPEIRASAVYLVEDGLIRKVWFLPKE